MLCASILPPIDSTMLDVAAVALEEKVNGVSLALGQRGQLKL
jgi:hypothetical protein